MDLGNYKQPEYISIAIISLEDFIAILDKIRLTEQVRGRKLHWEKLIRADQLTCPATNEVVAYCSYDKMVSKNGSVSYHFNFYNNKGVLFTVDHKIPKSQGGDPDKLENLQVMIGLHNWNKSSKLIYIK